MLNQKDPFEQMLSHPMINGGVKNMQWPLNIREKTSHLLQRYMLIRDVSSCKKNWCVGKLLTSGVHTYRINFVRESNSKLKKDKKYRN